MMEKKYSELIKAFGLENFQIYDIAGGKVVLHDNGELGIVYSDGRYPKLEDGFSLNQKCTEKLTVLYGSVTIEIKDKESFLLQVGETYAILPGNPYSVSGKGIVKVDISPKWDSSQNSFIN